MRASTGIDCVWGVDVSTKAIDVAIVCNDGTFQTNSIAVAAPVSLGEGVRLNLIRARCLTVSQAWAQHFPPVAVYVERPTGKHASPILTMAAGATLMGFTAGLADVFDHPVRAFLCAVSEWKKPVIGNGNASKELVMAWARGRGYDGDRQDAADALAIAHFGAAECAVWGFEERKVA